MLKTVSDRHQQQILKIRENAVVEVAAAWGGMTSLVELEAQVNHRSVCNDRFPCERNNDKRGTVIMPKDLVYLSYL